MHKKTAVLAVAHGLELGPDVVNGQAGLLDNFHPLIWVHLFWFGPARITGLLL